jgi:hypothetical protein
MPGELDKVADQARALRASWTGSGRYRLVWTIDGPHDFALGVDPLSQPLHAVPCSGVQISTFNARGLGTSRCDGDGRDTDALIQVGTNLSMVRLAAAAEMWLGKPVVAINTATYWHALRQNNIKDKIAGLGRLLEEF